MRAFPFIFICIQFLLINVVYADTATEVTVVHPLTELRGSALRLVGTVEAVQHAQLASEQSGRVDKIFVDVGDEVEKDQALLRLDDSLAKLAVAETASKVDAAAIELAEAKRLLKEVESLSQRQVIAATLVDERRARVASAAATVTQEQAILSYRKKIVEKHTLKAPFAGLVEHRSVSLGEWLSVQSVPFRLVSNDNFRVRVHIPQEYYFSLRQSSSPTVTVHHERLPSALEGLTINRLIAVSQQGTRSMPALIDLPADSGFVPGMSANVSIALAADENNRLWVPVSSIKQHPDGGASVIAVENNKAKRFNILIVERRATALLVTGIPSGAVLVSSGVEFLTEGMELNVASTQEFAL